MARLIIGYGAVCRGMSGRPFEEEEATAVLGNLVYQCIVTEWEKSTTTETAYKCVYVEQVTRKWVDYIFWLELICGKPHRLIKSWVLRDFYPITKLVQSDI